MPCDKCGKITKFEYSKLFPDYDRERDGFFGHGCLGWCGEAKADEDTMRKNREEMEKLEKYIENQNNLPLTDRELISYKEYYKVHTNIEEIRILFDNAKKINHIDPNNKLVCIIDDIISYLTMKEKS